MNFKLQSFQKQLDVSRIAYIHYFEFTNRYHTNIDAHNFCELLYVDSGTVTVHADSYTGDMTVNQLLIHRPNEVHSLSTSDTVAPNVIIIGFECTAEALIPFSSAPVTLSPDYCRALARIMTEAMNVYEAPYDVPNTTFMRKRESYPFGADQMIKNYLETFLIQLIRDRLSQSTAEAPLSNAAAGSIQAVYQYLSENYTANITLDNLCFLFGMNKTTLCQSFKAAYGTTILDFTNSRRLHEAKALLRAQNLTVTEISEKVGFSSVHYFCRFFKKHTGLTPQQYASSVLSRLRVDF